MSGLFHFGFHLFEITEPAFNAIGEITLQSLKPLIDMKYIAMTRCAWACDLLTLPHTIYGIKYFVAADRHDLSAEQTASIYKLRWTIETFFKWWKEHLKVYHLIARSEYGFMVQILGDLITYLLMAIYCRENFNQKVSIIRVRGLRATILNELFHGQDKTGTSERNIFKKKGKRLNAKT